MASWIALKARVDCPECGQPVMLDGPWGTMRCPSCQAETPIQQIWTPLVERASEKTPGGKKFEQKIIINTGWATPTVSYATNKNHPPICNCGKVLDEVSQIASGTDGAFHCPACGLQHETFPAPRFVRGSAVQVFLAVREDQQATPPAADAKPVLFSCPNCGANLHIDSEAKRIVTCQYCECDVFLPADLWHRLHPVRRRRAFWIRCH